MSWVPVLDGQGNTVRMEWRTDTVTVCPACTHPISAHDDGVCSRSIDAPPSCRICREPLERLEVSDYGRAAMAFVAEHDPTVLDFDTRYPISGDRGESAT